MTQLSHPYMTTGKTTAFTREKPAHPCVVRSSWSLQWPWTVSRRSWIWCSWTVSRRCKWPGSGICPSWPCLLLSWVRRATCRNPVSPAFTVCPWGAATGSCSILHSISKRHRLQSVYLDSPSLSEPAWTRCSGEGGPLPGKQWTKHWHVKHTGSFVFLSWAVESLHLRNQGEEQTTH